jgi:hypothetical protein
VTGFFGVCGNGSAPNRFSGATIQTAAAITSEKRIFIKNKERALAIAFNDNQSVAASWP